MKALRVLAAMIWLVFSLANTAYAHSLASPLITHDAPCSMAGMSPTPHQKQSHSDQGLMPCCSQSAAVAPAEILMLTVRRIDRLHLTPALAMPLIGQSFALEPAPPKAI